MREELKDLFDDWRKEHIAEAEEINEEIQKKNSGECDGRVFCEKVYEESTVSSHFVQFFHMEKCKECAGIKEDAVWKHVLKVAFNEDGIVGDDDIPPEGFRYIALLKEANDSNKNCVVENYQKHMDKVKANQWLIDWKTGKKEGNYRMLHKLNHAFNKFLTDQNEEPCKYFFEKMAYMNVNKRGGASTISDKDQTVLINYASKYKKYILKEIAILSKGNPDVTIFVCGKNGNYFKDLEKALCGNEIDKIDFTSNSFTFKYKHGVKQKKFKFVNITHPSGRISAEDLAEEMKQGGEN